MGKPILNINSQNKDLISSNNIIWQGPDIPCIELCNGDSVTSVVYKIAERICEFVTDIDKLKDLDYSCIIGYCETCPKDYSIKSVFELLLNNDCKLKELIDDIQQQIKNGNEVILSLDYKCLTADLTAICGNLNVENITIQKVFQVLINNICDIETNQSDLDIKINNLQSSMNSLNSSFVNNTPAAISNTCSDNLYKLKFDPNYNPLSGIEPNGTRVKLPGVHLETILDPLLCDINNKLGTDIDFNSAITSQCISDYNSASGIINNPTSLSDLQFNDNLILCDLQERINYLEQNCYSLKCSDISLGFNQTYSSVNNTITLSFLSNYGTDIPYGFVDVGSSITLTDVNGMTATFPSGNNLTTGYNWIINLSGFDITSNISVKIDSVFEATIPGNTFVKTSKIKCNGCFSGVISALNPVTSNICYNFIIPQFANAITTFQEFTYKKVSNQSVSLGSNDITNIFPSGVLPINDVQFNSYTSLSANQRELTVTFLNVNNDVNPYIRLSITINGYTNNDIYIKGTLC